MGARITWFFLTVLLVGCGQAPSVSVEAEKSQITAGGGMRLYANVDAYQGTYAVEYYWTIVTPDCGTLSNITGGSVYWISPRSVGESRTCQISVKVVLKDGRTPSYEETVTTNYFILVVPYDTGNKPPEVILVVPAQSVRLSESVSLSVIASDPEGGPLAYAWWATGGTFLGSRTGTGAVWIAPARSGIYTVYVTVTDQERASVGQSVEFTVTE